MTGPETGSGAPRTVVHPDADALAHAAAARLITTLVDAQAARGRASVVLTGGGIGIAALRAVADSPARDAVDWPAVDFWWGDERFLPTGDAERNETQAREALLDHVPVDQSRVHPMPAAEGPEGDAPDAGAARYAEALRARAKVPGEREFDVCLLGMGPDAHVASLFPDHPAAAGTDGSDASDPSVIAVHAAPKPPPTRISLTFAAIGRAAQVWVLASGTGKADAVHRALDPASDRSKVPAAGARGHDATLFLLDEDAASRLP